MSPKHASITVHVKLGWTLKLLQALALSSGFWAGTFIGTVVGVLAGRLL